MDKNEHMREIMRALGLLVETTRLIYDDCVRVGYSPEQALEMAKVPLLTYFAGQFSQKTEE